jgi:glycerophosphoryl diester phosphodiesterase
MRPLAIAHRGGNSLAGLREANRLGVDVIECDVHRHRGRLEVRHLKTAGPLPFLWDRWELAPATAPRLGLQELLEAGQHGATFMLDVKGRRVATARAVVESLRRHAADRPVLVCGRYWPAVEVLAALPTVRPVLSARNRVELGRLRRRLARLDAPPPPYGVSVHLSLLDHVVVAELHRAVEVVMTWPIDDSAALDHVLGLGVSGVISETPEVLAELLRRGGRGPAPGPSGRQSR